jgi:hypothetical protein
MSPLPCLRPLAPHLRSARALGTVTVVGLALAALASGPLPVPGGAARAQGTPGLMEFRWDNAKDYRKLYFYMTDTIRLKRSEYFLILRPKDRKTAILKLTITIPKYFDAEIRPKDVRLCRMQEGGMLKRTKCLETIPATIEVTANGRAIEIFPETPISDKDTIGVNLRIVNPFNSGMYQFNALAQAPGEVPISGYLGSWLIQIEPN